MSETRIETYDAEFVARTGDVKRPGMVALSADDGCECAGGHLNAEQAEALAIALVQATPVPSTMDGKADADEALVFIESDGAERAIAYGLALIRAAAGVKP